jgi:hypothetical protein
MMGGASAWGLRSLADTFLRYWQPGLPVYLRYQEQTNKPGDYSALGFQPDIDKKVAPSGITDVLIDPPPDVQEVSLHNIGIMGGQLFFGARTFLISNLFVLKRMAVFKYTDPYQVWRDDQVVGLYYNQRLFSLTSITHEEVGGETTLWKIIGNSSETASPAQ